MLLVWQFLLPVSWNKCSPWNPVTILWDTRYRGLMFRHSITIPASSQHLLPTMWLSYLVKYPDNYPSCHLISHKWELKRETPVEPSNSQNHEINCVKPLSSLACHSISRTFCCCWRTDDTFYANINACIWEVYQ